MLHQHTTQTHLHNMLYNMLSPNSQRMLDMATKKGCYSKLVRSDIEDYLNSSPPTRHDVIVSGDALQYVGPLERVFKEAYRVLRPGGHFALTVPLLTADPGVVKSAAVVSDNDDAVSDGVVSETDTTNSSSGTDGRYVQMTRQCFMISVSCMVLQFM
jgi:trans-aconitate methyltransferase